MNADQLQVLDSIVKTGSFRAAADHLHRAQSAVSYAIKSLEDSVGFLIFDRNKYRPELTTKGEAFYKESLKVLRELKSLNEYGEVLNLGCEPEIKVAVSAPVPMGPLAEVLKDFAQCTQHTKLVISHEVLGTEYKVIYEQVDLAITEVFVGIHPELDIVPLFEVPMVPVVASNHPLAKVKGSIKINDMKEFVHIYMKSTTNEGRQIKTQTEYSEVKWSVNDFYSKKEFLLRGLGWGGMPKHLVEEELQRGVLKELNIEEFKPIRLNMCLIKRTDKQLGKNGKVLWELFKKLKNKI